MHLHSKQNLNPFTGFLPQSWPATFFSAALVPRERTHRMLPSFPEHWQIVNCGMSWATAPPVASSGAVVPPAAPYMGPPTSCATGCPMPWACREIDAVPGAAVPLAAPCMVLSPCVPPAAPCRGRTFRQKRAVLARGNKNCNAVSPSVSHYHTPTNGAHALSLVESRD